MRQAVIILGLAIGAGAAAAQEPAASARAMLEAGKFQQAVEIVAAQGEGAQPEDIYLAGQSLSRLDRRAEARDTFGRLDRGDDQSAWTFIGRSAIASLDGNRDAALELANRAATLAPDNFTAQYQLGLVKTLIEDFGGAAEALERATQIDGNDAYAHYYAGLAFNKLRRIDKMTEHFRAFVRLAPNAPERPQVEAILRTLRR